MRDLKHPLFLLSIFLVSNDLDILVDYTVFSTNCIFLIVYMGLIHSN